MFINQPITALFVCRGFPGLGATSTSMAPADDIPSKPKPRRRQSLRTRGSHARLRPPGPTASHTSSLAPVAHGAGHPPRGWRF